MKPSNALLFWQQRQSSYNKLAEDLLSAPASQECGKKNLFLVQNLNKWTSHAPVFRDEGCHETESGNFYLTLLIIST